MSGSVADAQASVHELPALEALARTACKSARAAMAHLLLGVCLALLAPAVGFASLTIGAAAVVAVSAFVHLRTALAETRFALAARACLRGRWQASDLPELTTLRYLGRDRIRAAVTGWILAGIVSLLILPTTLSYGWPPILKVHGFVLAFSALRPLFMAMANGRFLRELSEHARNVAPSAVASM